MSINFWWTREHFRARLRGRRRRRQHSAEFKAQVVAACRKPGVSIAAVALEHRLNANLLRRWVVAEERAPRGRCDRGRSRGAAARVAGENGSSFRWSWRAPGGHGAGDHDRAAPRARRW